ncbi:hypothetical protein L226DRAFT_480320 [Lentinus tigrinus ALCF2SS1-7]|uniref:GTP binding protein 2 n=1 Tax=Lentinus tigrinus ALCF2SS1-6 TaxID=1328759 RepID=A0A5C2SNE3_9APHY|nr:hypothetical protein L227DRAFT_649345 [Lentinus tigrinus ALCF2SS1-6]RPD79434.1 hypothetical protein L226DRAFT_480320 [Lentinus tigrinus ALCF2SS1-7]
MFGELESESPRVPSPWDPFLPSPPNGSSASPQSAPLHNGIPKLVPEVEEGNIEYKLKLTSISNARFARLVTQLKWRLLEGGGQAYYELGVADSGALIGLSRADLEESLETLEMMAGEIGASVIVVKEIEVPPTIAALADKESGYTDPETGEWTRKMRRRPQLTPGLSSDGDTGEYCSTSATSTTELDTDFDFSAAELTDFDDFPSSISSAARTPGIVTPASTATSTATTATSTATTIAHRHIRTNPSRPTAQSSPFIAPIDDDLALFSMEPEPAFRDDEGGILPTSGVIADDELDVPSYNLGLDLGLDPRRSSFAGLEIAAVYKPRPMRHRTRPGAAPLGPTPGRHGKRLNKNKEKKVHPWHQQGQGRKGGQGGPPQISKEEKALQRRLARDKKREDKRNALIALAQGEQQAPADIADPAAPPASAVSTEEATLPAAPPVDVHSDLATIEQASALLAEVDSEADELVHGMDGLHAAVDDSPEVSPVLQARDLANMNITATSVSELEREPRLIVEALVVRKMSIEEATLDFSRLALI